MNWETEGLGKSPVLVVQLWGRAWHPQQPARIPEFLFPSLRIILFVQTGSLQTSHLEALPAPDVGAEHRRANFLAKTLAQGMLFPRVGVGVVSGMIRVRHICRAVYFYFYCISSTPDHQTSDPRAWGPLLQGTAIPSILHRKKRRQRSVHSYLRISIQWQPRDSNPQPGEAASCQAGTRPPTGGLLAGLGSGLQLRVMWPPQVGAQ